MPDRKHYNGNDFDSCDDELRVIRHMERYVMETLDDCETIHVRKIHGKRTIRFEKVTDKEINKCV
ncbi:MAG: hypothetical protein NC453_23705 [Muribaculum sp.]|nr:hypothetical protein [Muribaculum sp.]